MKRNKWMNLPGMEEPREGRGCALVNGKDVVMPGGETFSLETMSWRNGPTFTTGYMATVQLRNTFLIAGHHGIHQFNQQNYTWIERPEKVELANLAVAAVLISEDEKVCI